MRIAVGVAQPTQRVPEDVWRVAQHRFSALRVSVVPAGVANHTVFGAPFSCSAFFSGVFYMLFREFSWVFQFSLIYIFSGEWCSRVYSRVANKWSSPARDVGTWPSKQQSAFTRFVLQHPVCFFTWHHIRLRGYGWVKLTNQLLELQVRDSR